MDPILTVDAPRSSLVSSCLRHSDFSITVCIALFVITFSHDKLRKDKGCMNKGIHQILLSACFLVKNTFLVHNLSHPTFRTVKFHVTCAEPERTKKCDIPVAKVLICRILLQLIRAIPVTLRSVRRVINQGKVHDIFLPRGNTAVRH